MGRVAHQAESFCPKPGRLPHSSTLNNLEAVCAAVPAVQADPYISLHHRKLELHMMQTLASFVAECELGWPASYSVLQSAQH